jgi:hypothetical protein
MTSLKANQPIESDKQRKRLRVVQFYFKAPIAIVGILGCAYAIFLIVRFEEDTTPITSAAFAFMATLTALTFSFARVIETGALRDRLTFAGERLLHGAVLVLVAAILRAFVFLLYKVPAFVGLPIIKVVVSFAFGLFGGILFFQGVIFAHGGLRILNDLLLSRINRHKDWDHIW